MSQCAKCGSKRIIEDGVLFDTTRNSRVALHAGFQKDPTALLFTGDMLEAIRAPICGDCGFVEIFVQNAPQLYASYLEARSGRG